MMNFRELSLRKKFENLSTFGKVDDLCHIIISSFPNVRHQNAWTSLTLNRDFFLSHSSFWLRSNLFRCFCWDKNLKFEIISSILTIIVPIKVLSFVLWDTARSVFWKDFATRLCCITNWTSFEMSQSFNLFSCNFFKFSCFEIF